MSSPNGTTSQESLVLLTVAPLPFMLSLLQSICVLSKVGNRSLQKSILPPSHGPSGHVVLLVHLLSSLLAPPTELLLTLRTLLKFPCLPKTLYHFPDRASQLFS